MARANVVVAYDGSEQADNAVVWGARAAARRGAPLVVVTATGWTHPPAELYGAEKSGQEMVQEVADRGAQVARGAVPAIEVTAAGAQEKVLDAILDPTLAPQLIVVGHRGQGGLGLGQVGSVAFAVVNQARCPVAVIRDRIGEMPHDGLGSVVATDGSKHGQVAVDRAAQWAHESGSPLTIVSAWRGPLTPTLTSTVEGASKPQGAAASRAEQTAREILATAQSVVEEKYPGIKVETYAGNGRPAEVIVEQGRGASLIVVGARGRGELAAMVLGSVSREVIEHADCPVYVVR